MTMSREFNYKSFLYLHCIFTLRHSILAMLFTRCKTLIGTLTSLEISDKQSPSRTTRVEKSTSELYSSSAFSASTNFSGIAILGKELLWLLLLHAQDCRTCTRLTPAASLLIPSWDSSDSRVSLVADSALINVSSVLDTSDSFKPEIIKAVSLQSSSLNSDLRSFLLGILCGPAAGSVSSCTVVAVISRPESDVELSCPRWSSHCTFTVQVLQGE